MEKNLIKIVHSLRICSGSNERLKILKKYSDNDLWKKFLIFTYDEKITYGVSSPSDMTFNELSIDDDMFHELGQLANRSVTGNDAKELAMLLSKRYGEIPRLVLSRSIKAGISVKTINKAYPGLIQVFESMKGKDCKITSWPVASSIKYDGVKVFAFVSPTDIFFTTSSGAEFKFKSLYHAMRRITPGVYEGELISGEGKQVDRSTITGKLNKLLSGAGDVKNYTYMVYDCISIEDWSRKSSIIPFKDRYNYLIENIAELGDVVTNVKVVVQHILSNIEEVTKFFNYYYEQGYEGSMHRYLYDSYRWDRSERLVKKKAIKECILHCVDVIPHTNPAKGNIGSLVCVGSVDGKDISVKVGSGMSKFDVMQDPGYFIGNDIEVIYNTITTSDSGYSLFLPRFKRIKNHI